MTTNCDLLVLGGGSGGYACALRAADLGLSVALVEQDKLGGTCLHRGCIPTKALLHAGEVADIVRESSRLGVQAELSAIDIRGVQDYQSAVIHRLYQGLRGLVGAKRITYVEGSGRLTSSRSVRVGDQTLTADHVVLATGSKPKLLPGLDIDGDQVVTSDQAVSLDRIPRSAVILGGGVIGVEFASIWRSFGADVTVVEALPRLLPLEDESSSRLLERAFRRRGIALELGQRMVSVERGEHDVSLSLEDGRTLSAELILVAIGREPVSAGLGYTEAGVSLQQGYVVVDEICRTTVDSISAVGDLIATPQLAHVGFAEGMLVAERVAGLTIKAIDYPGVPRIAYCDPEVASVGLTSAQAREAGYEVEEVTYDLAGNGRSQILRSSGAVKLVAAKEGPVLGVHIVGPRAGELIAEGQLIVNWEALGEEVARLVHPHPTLSEALGEAHLSLAGRPLHMHA